MLKRSFAIPLVPILTLSLTVGCGSSLLGTWELQLLDGSPNEGTSTYQGCKFTYSIGLNLDFDQQDGDTYTGQANLAYSYTYGSDCGEYSGNSDSYTGQYAVSATQTGKREFDIDIDDLGVQLECTMNGNELSCLSEGSEYIFGRD